LSSSDSTSGGNDNSSNDSTATQCSGTSSSCNAETQASQQEQQGQTEAIEQAEGSEQKDLCNATRSVIDDTHTSSTPCSLMIADINIVDQTTGQLQEPIPAPCCLQQNPASSATTVEVQPGESPSSCLQSGNQCVPGSQEQQDQNAALNSIAQVLVNSCFETQVGGMMGAQVGCSDGFGGLQQLPPPSCCGALCPNLIGTVAYVEAGQVCARCVPTASSCDAICPSVSGGALGGVIGNCSDAAIGGSMGGGFGYSDEGENSSSPDNSSGGVCCAIDTIRQGVASGSCLENTLQLQNIARTLPNSPTTQCHSGLEGGLTGGSVQSPSNNCENICPGINEPGFTCCSSYACSSSSYCNCVTQAVVCTCSGAEEEACTSSTDCAASSDAGSTDSSSSSDGSSCSSQDDSASNFCSPSE
jgi:hypothetical protein